MYQALSSPSHKSLGKRLGGNIRAFTSLESLVIKQLSFLGWAHDYFQSNYPIVDVKVHVWFIPRRVLGGTHLFLPCSECSGTPGPMTNILMLLLIDLEGTCFRLM